MSREFVSLTVDQLDDKLDFINNYAGNGNAATLSSLDANANVGTKNIATLSAEINKDFNIQINRHMLCNKIYTMYGSELADEYLRQLKDHEIYTHDETSIMPYCVSISMYRFLIDGLTYLGGESKKPEHLNSYCGGFVNLVFAISSQFAGAVSTPEWLFYMDYFCRKDYGDDYLDSNRSVVENSLQHCVYALNQPAAARGYQAVFWNIAVFDRPYMESLFENFIFPDGSLPNWDSLERLQEFFLSWINKERTLSLLTFPVVTVNMLAQNNEPADKKFFEVISSQLADGNSFFIYQSDSVDSLSSCCRLRNELSTNTFSYTLGAGGIATGSVNVITININRVVQKNLDLEVLVNKIHKYQNAYRKIMEDLLESGLLTVYKAGFIDLKKQYSTIGVNGIVEAAEYLGIRPTVNDEYQKFVDGILSKIYNMNRQASKEYGFMFNTEIVPAENLGVKNANWDKKEGLYSPRECYNSYLYLPDSDINIVDMFILHGKEYTKHLDGGSALHVNLQEHPSKEGFKKLILLAINTGCPYFCFNIRVTICNDCKNIDKRTLNKCPKCGSTNIDYATRVIGYLKPISCFSEPRQREESRRVYHKL